MRGRVVAQQGPMVSVDTGKQVLRVNESKIRLDKDKWHDIDVPLGPDEDQPLSSLVPKPPASATLAEEDAIAQGLWQAVLKGKINFLELFSGSARLSAACVGQGLSWGLL